MGPPESSEPPAPLLPWPRIGEVEGVNSPAPEAGRGAEREPWVSPLDGPGLAEV
jgi:hypothetical protein